MKILAITFSNILTCLLSVSIFLFLVYLRITREIYVIDLVAEDINNYYYFFAYILFVSLFFLMVMGALWIIRARLLKNQKSNNYTFFLLFNFWYHRVNIFYKTYVIFFNYVGFHGTKYLIRLARKFIDWNNKIRISLIIAFAVLPRLVILSLLVYEIYHRCLHYYFYSLVLLFIPLIFKIFIFLLKDVGPRLLPEFKSFLIFDHSLPEMDVQTPEGIKKLKPLSIRFKPEYADLTLDHFLNTYYYPMLYIESEMAVRFLPIYTKINTLCLVIYSGVHAVACSYILVFLT